MIYDDLDFFILKKIYYSEETTTWDITKDYFNLSPNGKEETRKVKDKHNVIRYRLQKMSDSGLIFIEKTEDNKNEYNLIEDNVIFGKHKFPDGYSDSVMIRENGKWAVFEF